MPDFDPADRKGNDADLVRRRQRERARVMAVLLGVFVVLMFAITIVKIRAGMA